MNRLCLSLAGFCLGCLIATGGCSLTTTQQTKQSVNVIPPQSNMPRELAMTTLPPYRIAPPDILTISAIRVIPRAPYHLSPFDVVSIQCFNSLPDVPISGAYTIEPGGVINFGLPYGSVMVGGLTVEDARKVIAEQLAEVLRDPVVTVSLAQIAAGQEIAGEHLVAQDGTVTLGSYGSVYVAGMTKDEARAAIETHLSAYLTAPQVAVDVFAYNSKVYYVITEGAGLGDQVVRFPVTGNETVLDAIAQVQGLQSMSSKRIWIARPTPGCDTPEVLPVDWDAITGMGVAATNYQILPGDRIFIAEDKLVAADTMLGKLLSPVERILGVTLLGSNAVNSIQGRGQFYR